MQLDERTMRLIAVGASIAANCQSCLQGNIQKARANGCDEQDIAEAIWVGKMVRRGASTKMDAFAAGLSQEVQPAGVPSTNGCDCGE